MLAGQPDYLGSFDPHKGFKPSQRNLSEIFLQLAGSLQAYKSPLPYLRHMKSEHARIEAAYQATFGKKLPGYCPKWMSDEYLDGLEKNWNLLSQKLGLDTFANQFGEAMREGIKGTRDTGSVLVDVFNRHQDLIVKRMAGQGGNLPSDFEALRNSLIRELELDKDHIDTGGREIAKRDAIAYGLILSGYTEKLFARIDSGLKPADADKVKRVITSIILDCGAMAQSEFEAGIAESSIRKASTATR